MKKQIDYPIFDGHNDTLLSVQPSKPNGRSFFEKSNKGQLDLPRAQSGGFAGGFFAIFIDEPEQEETDKDFTNAIYTPEGAQSEPPIEFSYAQQSTISAMANLMHLEEQSQGKLKIARSVQEIEDNLQNNIMTAVMHIEGAEAIDTNLDALHVFYQAGLRSLGLVWSRPNAFGFGVPFKFPSSPDTGPGLTPAGFELVRLCNKLGIMVDVSHLNEKGFWDVSQISHAPLVATHSAAHALCPSARNLTDRQLDVIGHSGGLVGMTFCIKDLRSEDKPAEKVLVSDIAHHIDYIANRIGVDHVALGSDFDGAPIPDDLKDVSGLPKLIDALKSYGYDNGDLKKITSGNWLRVLRETWK